MHLVKNTEVDVLAKKDYNHEDHEQRGHKYQDTADNDLTIILEIVDPSVQEANAKDKKSKSKAPADPRSSDELLDFDLFPRVVYNPV